MIPHSRPDLGPGERAAVLRLLETGMIGAGDEETRFERDLAARVGGAVRLAPSGTAALAFALRLLDLPEGAEVIVPSYACFAVAEAVRAVGAVPVPCDVSDGWVMAPGDVRARLTARTGAVIAVHTFGIRCDVEAIAALGPPVVEDCCQALGRPEAGEACGASGELAVGSFHATKYLTTGRGGAVWSRHARWRRRLEDARATAMHAAPIGELGAAIGRAQLARFDAFATRRRHIAERYRAALGEDEAVADLAASWRRTTFFRFPLRCGAGFDAIAAHFAARGVTVRRGVDDLIHRRLGWPDEGFAGCLLRYATTVSVPLYPALSDPEVDRICAALRAMPRSG